MAAGLVRLGITANGLTIMGTLVGAGAAVLAAQGNYLSAGILFLCAGPFDALDGAVARASGKETRFGALLDSTLDRYSEALLLSGIGFSLARSGDWIGLLLAFLAVLGSLMVSYTRARSEGLAMDNKVGLLTRFERIILLGLAMLTGLVVHGLWVLTILTHFTVAQRVWHIYRSDRSGDQS
jgi:CDP-diacylglycerol--glycerol-3-phosphate 3-phosphatidyltransferase